MSFPDEIMINILEYCCPSLNLFLVNKRFEQLSTQTFNPGNESLLVSCNTNNIHMLKKLIKDPRIDLNYKFNKLFRESLNNHNLDFINLLLEDSRIDQPDIYIEIYHLVKNNKIEIIKRILNEPKINISNFVLSFVDGIIDCKYNSFEYNNELIKLILNDKRLNPKNLKTIYSLQNYVM